ncbi:MAG: ribosome maturation protein RimP [Sphingomicrobium sp.]
MADIAAITSLIAPEVDALGLRLVRVIMIGGTSDPTLQVMAERPETRQLVISDCEALSRRISEVIDAEEEAGRDPVEGAYRLEVSSPGIDRPLTRPSDYANWAGHEARIKFIEPQDGAKQISGIIEGIDGETVTISSPKGSRAFPFAAVAAAKLLLTDKLIKATAPLSTEGADQFEEEADRQADDVPEISETES